MHKKCHIKLNRNPLMQVFNLGFYTSYSIIVSRLGILLVQNQVQCLLPCHINGLCDHRTLYKVSITNGWYAHATTMLFETLRKIGSYIYIYITIIMSLFLHEFYLEKTQQDVYIFPFHSQTDWNLYKI